MTTFAFIRCLLIWLCIAAGPTAFAQMTTNFNFNNVNLAIPQNDPNGAQNSQTIAGVPGEITALQVSLLIVGTGDGAFDGNLYMELVNDDGGFAVLLNRVGMSSSNPFGYGDNGFDVTLSDSAANDVHFYQNYSYILNANGQVTGTWQPDGENISPLSDPSAFDDAQDNQTATLSSFNGDSPDDTWTLYAADVSQGDSEQVVSWSMNITTAPEPNGISLIAVGLIFWIWMGRRQKSALQQKF